MTDVSVVVVAGDANHFAIADMHFPFPYLHDDICYQEQINIADYVASDV
jgi:hypothetical protein